MEKINDKKPTTMTVSIRNRNKIFELKYKYGFSSIDATLDALFGNPERLNKLITKEDE